MTRRARAFCSAYDEDASEATAVTEIVRVRVCRPNSLRLVTLE